MSATTTSRTMKRGPRNHPAPLDLSLLGVPGPSNSCRTSTLVSAARPSIKESVAALGLNYSLSSGGVPELPDVPGSPPLQRPLPKIPGSPSPGFSPGFVLETSSDTSHYTTTTATTTSLWTPPLTTPPNLARFYTPSFPPSPGHQGTVDVAIRPLPPPPPPDLNSSVTPPLLTPAPARPARRWGMTVFPENKAIRRVSSAPSSPIRFDNGPASPTSIIAIKSPVERKDPKRTSDAFSLITPLTVSFPQERNVPPAPSTPTQTTPPTPPVSSYPPPAPKSEDPTLDTDIERSCSVSGMVFSDNNSLFTIEESDSPAKAEGKQPQSPQVRKAPKSPLRGPNSHQKRISSTYRRESAVRRPSRRLMLKRDSGAPFARQVAMGMASAPESSPTSPRPEGTEMKEGQRNTMGWLVSRKFLQTSTKRAKATVVMMRKGKAEEKDVSSVIPQLRELKAPKRMKW